MMGSAVAPKPKDKYELEVEGGENMRVGLVAVDEAVFLLNDKQTLTRKLVGWTIPDLQKLPSPVA